MVSKTVKARSLDRPRQSPTNYNKNKNQLVLNLILPNADIPEGLFEEEDMELPMMPQPPKAVYYPTKAEYVRENRRKTDNILTQMGIPPIAVGNPVMPFQSREPIMGAYNSLYGDLTPMEQFSTPAPVKKLEPEMEEEESDEEEYEEEEEAGVADLKADIERKMVLYKRLGLEPITAPNKRGTPKIKIINRYTGRYIDALNPRGKQLIQEAMKYNMPEGVSKQEP